MLDGFVVVGRFSQSYQAHLIKVILKSDGIDSWTTDELIAHHFCLSGAISGVILIVRDTDAESALKIIEQAKKGQYKLLDEDTQSQKKEDENANQIKNHKTEKISIIRKILSILLIFFSSFFVTTYLGYLFTPLLKKRKTVSEVPDDLDFGDKKDLQNAEQEVKNNKNI